MIRCVGQQDSNKICLTYPQFDFYAKNLVERNRLVIDTGLLKNELVLKKSIIFYKDNQISGFKSVIIQKDSIINTHKHAYDNLYVKYEGEVGKVKVWKQASLTMAIISCFLGIVIIAK